MNSFKVYLANGEEVVVKGAWSTDVVAGDLLLKNGVGEVIGAFAAGTWLRSQLLTDK